jgi:hypothetical protein
VGSRPDLPLCREASNYSSLHPSRRFSSPSRWSSVFDQALEFLAKRRYGKIAAIVPTTGIPVRMSSSIRQVSQFKSRRPNASHYSPDVRTSDMEITCIRSAVRTTVPLVQTCDCPDDKAHRPDVALKQERSSAKFLEFQLHGCPSGQPMTIVQTAPSYIKPDSHLNC